MPSVPSIFLLAFVVGSASTATAQSRFGQRGIPHLPPGIQATHGLAFGDIDGDGDLDLVRCGLTTAPLMGRLEVLANDGDGNFTDASAGVPRIGYPQGAVALGDIDGDGDLDMVCGPHLLENDGAGNFVDVTGRGGGTAGLLFPSALEFVDIDTDGDLDVLCGEIAGNWGASPLLALWVNDGTGWFTRQHLAAALRFAVGDVDGDGDPDIVCSGQEARLLLNDGRGVFQDATATHLPNQTAGVPALADTNRDGHLDLVLGGMGQNRLLHNDGTGRFTDVTLAVLPQVDDSTLAVAAIDVDEDEDVDLVVANDGQNRLLLNDGRGVFVDGSAAHMPADAAWSSVLAYADIDGDLDVDLVFGNGSYSYGRRERGRIYHNLTRQLDTPSPPRVGQDFVIAAYVRPGRPHPLDLALVCLSPGRATLPVAGLGTLALDPSRLLILPPALVDASGVATVTLAVPDAQHLVGSTVHVQALAVPRLGLARFTNAISDVVRSAGG